MIQIFQNTAFITAYSKSDITFSVNILHAQFVLLNRHNEQILAKVFNKFSFEKLIAIFEN